jgi:hypothetical protein
MTARIWAILPFAFTFAAPIALCQASSTGPPPVVNFSDGGASPRGTGPMESIFVPPKPNAPFSMKLAAEWTRPMAGGGSFTLVNERAIMRDRQGRIYQERRILVPKGSEFKSEMSVFQITDPLLHIWYNCSPNEKVCDLMPYDLTPQMKYQPKLWATGPLPDGRGVSDVVDLGINTVEGQATHGYRESITFNPGTMGNDQPMTSLHEFWFCSQLGFNLLSIVDNPQTGKQVFTVKELTTSEPELSMFQVPDGYKIIDRREEADKPPNQH